MTRISVALVTLAAALLSQLEQTHASLILRVPDEENVVLAEVTMPFNHLVGLRANETHTPSRESLPVTFVNDELMTSLCEGFQSDSIDDAYAGHLLVFHDGLDFMCHGTIGKHMDYKYMEKWCQLDASIVIFSQTYDYMLAHPMDRFREILAGEAGDAVASCFWARGRAVTSDEASTALRMVQENPGLYLGNVSIDYTRFKRSIGWLVWTGVMSVTFFAVSIMGIRILVHRLRISYQISAMHVIVLCINICVTFLLGSISAAKLACRVPMGLVLLVYQDFFTLGTATSVLLIDIYADALERLSLDKGHSFRKLRKRSFVVALFLLLAIEFFADYAVMGNNTGGETILVVIIAPTLILIQIVVIASLWRKTTETANLLRNAHLSQRNTSTVLFREIELHLRFWVRISVIAAVGAIATLVLVASGFIESQYNLVRGLFDASRCLGLLAEINACKSLRKPKSKLQRKLSSKANPRSVAKKRQSRAIHPRSTMATVASVNRAADANSNSGIDMINSLVTEDPSSREVYSEIQEVRSDRLN